MGYKILKASQKHWLEAKVRNAIQKGWKPQGSVTYKPATFGSDACWSQAMVRNQVDVAMGAEPD